MLGLVLAFSVTRAALVAAILVALATIPVATCAFCSDVSAQPILAALARWDGAHYLDIAQRGYAGEGREALRAYSPLYPLLMRLFAAPFGGSTDALLVAGIAVSNGALLWALRSIVALAREHAGEDAARRAALYVLVFPSTVFLSAVYAESLFLALAVASGLEADRSRWWRSGVFAALAAITRPFGVLAVLPLVYLLWRARARPREWLAAALAPGAALAWAGYLFAISGDALEVVHAYASWGRAPSTPVEAFSELFDAAAYGFPWIVLALVIAFAGLVAWSWRVMGPAYGVAAIALFLVVTSKGSLTSSVRYELALYPAFVALGAVTADRAVRVAWTAASACLALAFASMYALWMWIG